MSYDRLFSHASIWRRRPDGIQAAAYLGMSYLYKRSNRFWHLLIKHRQVHRVWRPLVKLTRWRHQRAVERGLGSEEIATGPLRGPIRPARRGLRALSSAP